MSTFGLQGRLTDAHNNDVLSIHYFTYLNPASEKAVGKACDPGRTDKLGGMVSKLFYGVNQSAFHAFVIRPFLLYSLTFRLKGSLSLEGSLLQYSCRVTSVSMKEYFL